VKLSGWDICNESRLMVVPKMLRQAAAAVTLAGAILLIPFGVSARGVNGERDFGWRDLQDKTARSEFFLMPLSSRSKNIFIENSALREA
jgi:hypothetical protein